jgi:phosphoribosylformylglycinamidine (FGAM) synthase-like enzyme
VPIATEIGWLSAASAEDCSYKTRQKRIRFGKARHDRHVYNSEMNKEHDKTPQSIISMFGEGR